MRPEIGRHIGAQSGTIRFGLAEFTSSHDNKPMLSLWINDREPDGRTINVDQDGSRGVSIRKTYGEMWPIKNELGQEFSSNVLGLIQRVRDSNEFYVATIIKVLREKLKTGRPESTMTLQEFVVGS